MKRSAFAVLVIVLWLARCSAPEPTPALEITQAPESAPAPTEMVVPEGKIPAAPFESQTYINEAVGFALDYPAAWIVTESAAGDRGSQVVLSASGIADLAELPAGETRLTVAVNQWDPQNDLAAFVDMRKTAWDASGFTILEEEERVLDLGLSAQQFIVQTPDGKQALLLFAAVGDQYVTLSGEGDLELVREIALRLRPVSK